MDNKTLWNKVCVTDPKHVKPITGKDYGGNSPKPYWIVERMTEEFGPCGLGWGYSIDSERFEKFSDTDTLHVAKVTLWYVLGDRRGEVTQMGQTKATYVTSKGQFKVDEDAPKKSVTDALVKCASYLGFAGDIFSGRWDDSKYVAEAKKHYEESRDSLVPVLQASIAMEKAKKGVVADVVSQLPPLTQDEADYFRDLAADVAEVFKTKGQSEAFDRIEREQLDNDQRIHLWGRLDSKIRSALKSEKGLRVGAA